MRKLAAGAGTACGRRIKVPIPGKYSLAPPRRRMSSIALINVVKIFSPRLISPVFWALLIFIRDSWLGWGNITLAPQ